MKGGTKMAKDYCVTKSSEYYVTTDGKVFTNKKEANDHGLFLF
jgi:hypothetical protein